MTLELGGRKVVVTGKQRELVRTSAESVSHDEADVVILIREWEGDVSELKQLLEKIEAQVASQPPNGAAPISLWRQTMAQKSYW